MVLIKNPQNELYVTTKSRSTINPVKSAMKWLSWKSICLLLMVFGGRSVVGQATDLMITEYVEGNSNNKYIEVFNGTGNS